MLENGTFYKFETRVFIVRDLFPIPTKCSVYIYIYIYTRIYMYIYIYREREIRRNNMQELTLFFTYADHPFTTTTSNTDTVYV